MLPKAGATVLCQDPSGREGQSRGGDPRDGGTPALPVVCVALSRGPLLPRGSRLPALSLCLSSPQRASCSPASVSLFTLLFPPGAVRLPIPSPTPSWCPLNPSLPGSCTPFTPLHATASLVLPPVLVVVFSGARLLDVPLSLACLPWCSAEKELGERPLSERKKSFGKTV